MKKMAKAVAAILVCAMVCGFFAGCGQQTYDNENDPLVFSTLALDGVFNPFFSTSATDSNVVGFTQIGMIGNDKDAHPTYGDDEAVAAKDVGYITKGTPEVDQTTTYYFVLKNNVRFSNGTYLTMKDVLFNFYVYLDPVYTGSTTMYSTDIVGLKEYRTQSSKESEQDAFMDKFRTAAQTRIDDLIAAADEILDEFKGVAVTPEKFEEEMTARGGNIANDYKRAIELFRDELKDDFSAARDSYQDTVFTNANGEVVRNLFTTDVEQFLYNEGYITWDKKANGNKGALEYATGTVEVTRAMSAEEAMQFVFDANIPTNFTEVIQFWVTASNLFTELTNAALEEYYQDEGHTREYKNISGIKFINKDQPLHVTVKDYVTGEDKTLDYAVPTYNADKSQVIEGNEVLAITIHDIDPKAIWNFSVIIAPMYYYSDAEHIAAFDYEENFGVEWGSQKFMNEVVGSPAKNDVPVGAGPYMASKAAGGTDNVGAGEFYSGNIVYYERNPFFVMGPAKIKKVRLQVATQNSMVSSLYAGELDFVEPNAKTDVINDLNAHKDAGIHNTEITTAGYGYIGINAGKVPNLKVRQAIMHCVDTSMCVNYYGTHAEAVYRPMTRALTEYYPTDLTVSYYPFIGGQVPTDDQLLDVNPDYRDFVKQKGKKAGEYLTADEQKEFICGIIEKEGYTLDSTDVYKKGTDRLHYIFTVVGDETDHPAYQALYQATEMLNKWGFEVNVKTDHDGLTKLATGALTVWAAAWGSTLDPDMYQVYHKDSTATSTANWGYAQIKLNAGNRYYRELPIVNDLSDLIDAGREVNEAQLRAPIYRDALDLVMQLAVELPTYQRTDLFAYNANKIDETTFTPESERGSFQGLTSDMHLISLNVER